MPIGEILLSEASSFQKRKAEVIGQAENREPTVCTRRRYIHREESLWNSTEEENDNTSKYVCNYIGVLD